MKNIHILPTDKSSKLVKNNLGIAINEDFTKSILDLIQAKFINIYITSDEEIKDEDWAMSLSCDESYREIYKCKKANLVPIEDRKIIITTDKDLIKDGIQAIDDEFLEWICNNPSCEEVKVVDDLKYFNIDELRERHIKKLPHLYSEKIGYKIIIPKEEYKSCPSLIIDVSKCNFPEIEYKNCTSLNIKLPPLPYEYKPENCLEKTKNFFIDKIDKAIENSKKETIEEARANSYIDFAKSNEDVSAYSFVAGWDKSAEWQQERSYSEKNVLEIIKFVKYLRYMDGKKPQKEYSFNEILEQFKNK